MRLTALSRLPFFRLLAPNSSIPHPYPLQGLTMPSKVTEERFSVRVYKEYFNFAAAHFLIFSDGSRENLHGHNYKVEAEIEAPIGKADLVIDFIELKPVIREICNRFDHQILLPTDNPHLNIEVGEDMVSVTYQEKTRFSFPKEDVTILDIPNTSTEMLARYFASHLLKELPTLFDGTPYSLSISVEESPGQAGICKLYFEQPENKH